MPTGRPPRPCLAKQNPKAPPKWAALFTALYNREKSPIEVHHNDEKYSEIIDCIQATSIIKVIILFRTLKAFMGDVFMIEY